ncbi:hypothetical protein NBZ79_18275 [Sneathiella marina]|uniref:Uncharacterized protein n=1 Tax=Sneathiella marina TaxID=2950108 RepID=A0ABY4W8Y3_9PROT|nr:hypothetical protein [Sneathiella marina]USG61106.1 hypothetical protein NBZ79_18275 [Sneathiella marina]
MEVSGSNSNVTRLPDQARRMTPAIEAVTGKETHKRTQPGGLDVFDETHSILEAEVVNDDSARPNRRFADTVQDTHFNASTLFMTQQLAQDLNNAAPDSWESGHRRAVSAYLETDKLTMTIFGPQEIRMRLA